MIVAGIDVGKETLAVSIIDTKLETENKNSVLFYKEYKNNSQGVQQMSIEFRKRKVEKVVIEYTGIYSYKLYKYLQKYWKKEVFIISGDDVKKLRQVYFKNTKTDKLDSFIIAKLHSVAKPYRIEFEEFVPMAIEYKLIINTLRRVNYIKKEVLSVYGNQNNLKYLVTSLTRHKKQLEQKMKETIKDSPFVKLTEIPGISFVNSFLILAELKNFTRFRNLKAFLLYCGVVPRVEQSGKSNKKKISLRVNSRIKTYFFMAALASVRSEKGFKQYFKERVEQGQPKKKVLMKIARKIASQFYHILKEIYND